MHEPVSVYQALRKGHRSVSYPSAAILLAILLVNFILCACNVLPFWTMAVGLVVAVAAAWLYWSVMITRWRLWAFEHVRNVHELNTLALEERLIWPEGSVYARTEIRNFEQKQRWLVLQEKFQQADIFTDDPTVSAETSIYYLKGLFVVAVVSLLLFGGFGLYAGIVMNTYLGLLAPAAISIPAYLAYRKAANRDAQITINARGIYTVKAGFHNWEDIQREQATIVRYGKSADMFLSYDVPGAAVKVRINNLTINVRKLNHLLRIYRGRYEQQAKRFYVREAR
ncbi:MAG: hypothetical protein EOP49_18330 [Sphingobacteriales bacterium]|nr:MAG: hypothetical protein EOP49_18330 [Sphingobacteriales bacterium]